MSPSSSAHVSQTTAARRAVPPLALIAVVFFLPTFRRCHEFGFERPLDYADDGAAALWIVPVFAGAALLALLTLRALRRREVDLASRRWALLVIAVTALLEAGTAVVFAWSGDWAVALPGVAAAALAAWTIRHGRGQTPWRIWEHLLFAFALLAAGAGPTVFLVSTAIAWGVEDFAVGAYVYLAAIAALLWITRRATSLDRLALQDRATRAATRGPA